MRKKVRGIPVRASPDVIDRRLVNAELGKLCSDQDGEIAVRLLALATEHRALPAHS
jgi:hypothetical protein